MRRGARQSQARRVLSRQRDLGGPRLRRASRGATRPAAARAAAAWVTQRPETALLQFHDILAGRACATAALVAIVERHSHDAQRQGRLAHEH